LCGLAPSITRHLATTSTSRIALGAGSDPDPSRRGIIPRRTRDDPRFLLHSVSVSVGAAPQHRHTKTAQQNDETRHDTTRHGTARHGTARHGTARHGTTRHDTARTSLYRRARARENTEILSLKRRATRREPRSRFRRSGVRVRVCVRVTHC